MGKTVYAECRTISEHISVDCGISHPSSLLIKGKNSGKQQDDRNIKSQLAERAENWSCRKCLPRLPFKPYLQFRKVKKSIYTLYRMMNRGEREENLGWRTCDCRWSDVYLTLRPHKRLFAYKGHSKLQPLSSKIDTAPKFLLSYPAISFSCRSTLNPQYHVSWCYFSPYGQSIQLWKVIHTAVENDDFYKRKFSHLFFLQMRAKKRKKEQ